MDLSVKDIISAVYSLEDHPFRYKRLLFKDLPEKAQTFLQAHVRNVMHPNGLLEHYIPDLNSGRQLERLSRTLFGVHRAIALGMMDMKRHFSESTLDLLKNVLIPEWRSHLDDYLCGIDALIWEKLACEDTDDEAFESVYEVRMEERQQAVEDMIMYVLRQLQETKEELEDRDVTHTASVSDVSEDFTEWSDSSDNVDQTDILSSDSGSESGGYSSSKTSVYDWEPQVHTGPILVFPSL